MIQSRELRLGNLVIWNPKLSNPNSTLPPMFIEVYEVMQDRITYVFPNIENRVEPFEDDIVQMGTRTKLLSELEPVKLTEEVLLNAGFQEKKELLGARHFLKNNLQLQQTEDGFKMDMKSIAAFEVSIKYLHQLQNLYFSVVGEELDIQTGC